MMPIRSKPAIAATLALSLGLGLAACGDLPNNRSLYSVKQPVIGRQNYTLDVAAGADGLAPAEQARLADWFDTMNLRYGDRVAIDGSTVSDAAREDIANIVGGYSLLMSNGAPITEGFVAPGTVRVVVTRSRAHVPGCPDWSDRMGSNLDNSTSDGFGCSVNSNMAAMVADPEHLIKGAEPSDETVMSNGGAAINTYRTGGGSLPSVSSQPAAGS